MKRWALLLALVGLMGCKEKEADTTTELTKSYNVCYFPEGIELEGISYYSGGAREEQFESVQDMVAWIRKNKSVSVWAVNIEKYKQTVHPKVRMD